MISKYIYLYNVIFIPLYLYNGMAQIVGNSLRSVLYYKKLFEIVLDVLSTKADQDIIPLNITNQSSFYSFISMKHQY